ncbi:hypothetical protein JS958_003090 [Salmonella enterica subsp. enterica serovar Infantis]|nr:hypothetical protein [Salmonella enterica]EHA1743123.1 hypothetical protein [Salmonella enterica subsp. enterica serovar Javiana]EHC4525255.1 hypothetical protein [Salmonella enterica subsp. enterica serovar Infantis]ECL4818262.1 hypothetical protein [Salmonella enterica]EHJ8320781.1 hypothetical protein [Salmonella enterica subsp. enterica serovar Infantis]
MSAAELLRQLQAKGVSLWVDGEKIHFRTLHGQLTPADRQAINVHYPQLIVLLGENDTNKLPLTELQQAYLTGSQPGLPLGGLDAVYCLELQCETLDPAKLQHSLSQMIEGHPVLRCELKSDRALHIHASVPKFPLSCHDLRKEPVPGTKLAELRQQLFIRRRNYQRWPLFDVILVRMTQSDWRLLLRLDLLIADAWSGYNFIRDWLALYAGQSVMFPKLSPVDLRLEEQRARREPDWQRAREWWQGKIARFPPPPALSVSSDPCKSSAHTARASRHLALSVWQPMKQQIRQHNVTPSTFLLALFVNVLARWSQSQHEILINLTLFQRAGQHPERHRVLGDFTNNLIVPFPVLQTGEGMLEHSKQVQERLWEYLEYGQFSGVQVLRLLSEKSPAHNILAAPVVFTSLLFDIDGQPFDFTLPGWQQRWAISRTPQVALDFQLYEAQGQLVLSWDYASDLLARETVEAVLDSFVEQLTATENNTSAWLNNAPELIFDAKLNSPFRLGQYSRSVNPPLNNHHELILAQHRVARCWGEILGRVISPDYQNGFMEAGGSSVQTVQLQMLLSREFNRDIPVSELFQYTTITSQARLFCTPATDISKPPGDTPSRNIQRIAGYRRRN